MTAKQRAQVVELLRCAADEPSDFSNDRGDCIGMTSAEFLLYGKPTGVWDQARSAWLCAAESCGYDYQTACLEAALRVELGEWP